LNESFFPKARDFIDALREGEAKVTIASTRRPEQRQYLMHWSWMIKKEDYWFETTSPCVGIPPNMNWFIPAVPSYAGDLAYGSVDIIWLWLDNSEFIVTLRNCPGNNHFHTAKFGEALAGATGMVEGYNLVYRPARNSRHSDGRAIDMTIMWSGDLTIAKKDGSIVTITSSPKNGSNHELQAVGATYGVYKLESDPPHWSDDGH
jgi:hypothetical protein